MRPGRDGREILVKCFFNLRGDFQCEGVQSLPEIANILQKLIVENDGRNRRGEAGSGGHQSFRDSGRNRTKTGGTRTAQAGEGVNDAPNGSEQADEGSYGAGGSQPRHAFFDAANFLGSGQLHANRYSLQAFELGRMRITGAAADLALQFAIACGVDRGKRRARGSQRLRVRNASRGAENAKKLVALPADATEDTQFLKNHRPGNNGKHQEKRQNSTRDPAGLFENLEEISGKNRCEQKNDVPLSENKISLGLRNVAYAPRGCNQLGCVCFLF